MGAIGSKSRSPGQILVKSCLHSLGYIFGLSAVTQASDTGPLWPSCLSNFYLQMLLKLYITNGRHYLPTDKPIVLLQKWKRQPLGLSKSGLKDQYWTVPKVVSNPMYSGCRK